MTVASAFAPGQLVRITDKNHPWYLAYGVIKQPFSAPTLGPDLRWEVELEDGTYGAYGGQRVAVAEHEIRRADV